MIKVFLMEDETVIWNGIKNNIPWEKEGLEFAGEASDGELAYPLIRKVQPDILITDVRMPFIDGLELSELVKKEFPRIKIVMLSGYNELDYIKQAAHTGVTDYLLKPITAARLLEVVRKVVDAIEEEEEDARLMDKYRLEMTKSTVLECQRLLCDLVTGWVSFKETLEHGEQVGIDLSVSFYQFMLFKPMPVGSTVAYPDRVVSCQETIRERMESWQHVLVFDWGGEGRAFIPIGESEREVGRRMRKCATSLGELTRARKDIQYFDGIGSRVNRLGDLQTSYLQAGRAFAVRSFTEINRVISYSQMDGVVHGSGETIDTHSVDASKVDRKILENFLKQGAVDETSGFVEEYFQNVGEKNCQSSIFRQYIAMGCYLCISTFLEQLGSDMGRPPWELSDMGKVLKDGYTLGASEGKLARLPGEVMTSRDSQTAGKYSQVLGEARAFIHDNYAKEGIFLNTVAARVNIGPSHFSFTFSQKTGVTFVGYLTEARMEKAKELLMYSNLKTSEIGYEVGYKDSHYFGYLSKKTAECTSKEYRAGSREAL